MAACRASGSGWRGGSAATWLAVSGRNVTARILLISETRDAATPYTGAVATRARFPSASLIAGVAGSTHSSSLSGVACVDDAVARYLRTGAVPARVGGSGPDRRCGAVRPPVPTTYLGRSGQAVPDDPMPAVVRRDLIAATTRELEKVAAMVSGGRLKGAAKIGLRVGQVANKYKVRKHFQIAIGEGTLTVKIDEASVAAEAALDGLYVLRTSVASDAMSDQETVLNYKRLAEVEPELVGLLDEAGFPWRRPAATSASRRFVRRLGSALGLKRPVVLRLLGGQRRQSGKLEP